MKSFKELLRNELIMRGYKVLSTKKEVNSWHNDIHAKNDCIVIDQETMPMYTKAAKKPEYRVIQVLIYTNERMSKYDMEKTVEEIRKEIELDSFHKLDVYVC